MILVKEEPPLFSGPNLGAKATAVVPSGAVDAAKVATDGMISLAMALGTFFGTGRAMLVRSWPLLVML